MSIFLGFLYNSWSEVLKSKKMKKKYFLASVLSSNFLRSYWHHEFPFFSFIQRFITLGVFLTFGDYIYTRHWQFAWLVVIPSEVWVSTHISMQLTHAADSSCRLVMHVWKRGSVAEDLTVAAAHYCFIGRGIWDAKAIICPGSEVLQAKRTQRKQQKWRRGLILIPLFHVHSSRCHYSTSLYSFRIVIHVPQATQVWCCLSL